MRGNICSTFVSDRIVIANLEEPHEFAGNVESMIHKHKNENKEKLKIILNEMKTTKIHI